MKDNTSLDLSQHVDLCICRHCGEKKVKTFGKVNAQKRIVWVDQFGERWYGKKCPQCYLKYKLKYDAERRVEKGHRPIGSTTNCKDCSIRFVVRVGCYTRCQDCSRKYMKEMSHSRMRED